MTVKKVIDYTCIRRDAFHLVTNFFPSSLLKRYWLIKLMQFTRGLTINLLVKLVKRIRAFNLIVDDQHCMHLRKPT